MKACRMALGSDLRSGIDGEWKKVKVPCDV